MGPESGSETNCEVLSDIRFRGAKITPLKVEASAGDVGRLGINVDSEKQLGTDHVNSHCNAAALQKSHRRPITPNFTLPFSYSILIHRTECGRARSMF